MGGEEERGRCRGVSGKREREVWGCGWEEGEREVWGCGQEEGERERLGYKKEH